LVSYRERPWRKRNVILERSEGLVQSGGNQDLLATKGLIAEAGEIEEKVKTQEDPLE
jgi:hypothetical protein